jgi:uncharacterized protein (DUF849 family)
VHCIPGQDGVVLLEACLNGARGPDAHPRVPVDPDALARDAVAVLAQGADALHVHVRGADGAESYSPEAVAATLGALRAEVDAPVGVSTGAWVVPDPGERLALVTAWDVLPDFASVNFHEPGAAELAATLLERGVGVEAGLCNADAARVLIDAGLADRCVRFLLEPIDQDLTVAAATLDGLLATLDGVAPATVRLLHGFGDTTWPMLRRAAALGYASRIGLEDTLVLPDGTPAPGNAALVAAGRRLLDG